MDWNECRIDMMIELVNKTLLKKAEEKLNMLEKRYRNLKKNWNQTSRKIFKNEWLTVVWALQNKMLMNLKRKRHLMYTEKRSGWWPTSI